MQYTVFLLTFLTFWLFLLCTSFHFYFHWVNICRSVLAMCSFLCFKMRGIRNGLAMLCDPDFNVITWHDVSVEHKLKNSIMCDVPLLWFKNPSCIIRSSLADEAYWIFVETVFMFVRFYQNGEEALQANMRLGNWCWLSNWHC